MKTRQFRFIAFSVLLSLVTIGAQAEDLRKIVSLSGYWKFSIGDDSKWSSPSYDDSAWDQITVPGQWEEKGYDDYNGYAWYRKTFTVSGIPEKTTIYLLLGRIDDCDEVYLNGKLIGKSGKFPPNFITAYDRERKYIIPAGYLKEDADNVISVKVYDSYMSGGITAGPAGIYFDADNDLLSLDLSGNWKFQTGDNKVWKTPDYDDGAWKEIAVPSVWENQGYENYDGYAWYRLKFDMPQNLKSDELYLSLGKIDDIDDVYLNGQHIGNVYDLRKSYYYRWDGGEYNTRRIYRIPEGSLKPDGQNTIAVRVRDDQGLGGIYEGPIGIMSAENYQRYKNIHHSTTDRSFWLYIIDKVFYNDNSWEE